MPASTTLPCAASVASTASTPFTASTAGPAHPSQPSQPLQPVQREQAPEPFVYPPSDPGLPAIDLESLLDAQAELIGRIRVCFGVARETFEHEVMTIIRRYAAFVHLLPATPDNYFNVPGGLLQLGLETAFFALQGTDAHIFSGRATITSRRHLEPRWRLATFIGGLCSDIQRTISRVVVTDRTGNEWPSYTVGLHPWLQTQAASRYFLMWRSDAPANPGLSLFALPLIVPAATLQHLAQGNSVVVPHLMASLASTTLVREHNILDQLVRRSAALVIDRFLQASAQRQGKAPPGAHLQRFLVEGLRRLVASDPAWQPNSERSRVWFGADGLFIVWPHAAADLRKLLEADQLRGMPGAPETMLDILLDAGVLMAQPDGRALWTIDPPGTRTRGDATAVHAVHAVTAVKLSAPGLVLSGLELQPIPLHQALAAQSNDRPETQQVPQGPQGPQEPSRSAPRAAAAPNIGDMASGAFAQAGAAAPLDHAQAPGARPIPKPSAKPSETPNGMPPVDEDPGAEGQGAAGSTTAMTDGPQADAAPRQLELPIHPTLDPTPDVTRQLALPLANASVQDTALAVLSLRAPMRLAPPVRRAIEQVISALNAQDGSTAALVTASGLFIGLDAFDECGVPAPVALRALSDAGMLQGRTPQTEPTQTLRIGGREVRGVEIAGPFIDGWSQ